jgi:nitrogen-specific signal transduction histidine kinase
MDQAPIQEIDIHEGLESTLTILSHKLKAGSITVTREYDRTLPRRHHHDQIAQIVPLQTNRNPPNY